MRLPRSAFYSAVVFLMSVAACHRAKPVVAVAPPHLYEEHCWWAVSQTAYPLDTVVNRFNRAFVTVGFTRPETFRVSDTAWVSAGPKALTGYAGGQVGARVAAYQHGDSTHYRIFVEMPDSSGSQTIPLCHQISLAAPLAAVTLREPDGEEKLSVWRRRQ